MLIKKNIQIVIAVALATTWLPDLTAFAQSTTNASTSNSPVSNDDSTDDGSNATPATSTVDPVDGTVEARYSAKVDKLSHEVAELKKQWTQNSSPFTKWPANSRKISTKDFQAKYAANDVKYRHIGNRTDDNGDIDIDINDPAYATRRYNTHGYDRGTFDDLLSQCGDHPLEDLRRALRKATYQFEYMPGGKFGAAQYLKDTLAAVVKEYLVDSGMIDYAPLSHTLEAVYFADFISGVLLDNVQNEMPDKLDTAGEVAFLGIRQIYGIIFWSAEHLDGNWDEFRDLAYKYEDPYSERYRLPPIYFTNFRGLAQKFLGLVDPTGSDDLDVVQEAIKLGKSVAITPVLANDRVELKFTQAVLFSVAHLLDESLFRREFWFEIDQLVGLQDDIGDMLTSDGSQYQNVRWVHYSLKHIIPKFAEVQCEDEHHDHHDGDHHDDNK